MQFDQKLQLVERATWESAQNREGQEVIATPTWVRITSPKSPTAFLNGVLRCELSDDEADTEVPSTISHYRELKLPFRWKIVPSSRPRNLSERLEKNGLALKEKLFGLIGNAKSLSVAPNPNVRVETVTLQNLEAWLTVQADAWNVPPPGIQYQRRSMTEALTTGKSKYENYLAYIGDKPVGSAAMRIADDYVLLMGGAVNETYRHQDVYRTLTAHRLNRIAELNLPAVVHCLENTSAPICLKLGFEKVCEILSFEPMA